MTNWQAISLTKRKQMASTLHAAIRECYENAREEIMGGDTAEDVSRTMALQLIGAASIYDALADSQVRSALTPAMIGMVCGENVKSYVLLKTPHEVLGARVFISCMSNHPHIAGPDFISSYEEHRV